MVDVIFNPDFRREFKKINDKGTKERIIQQLSKIQGNPLAGKPMRYGRKGTRELYIPPFRLSYLVEGKIVYVLTLYHKNRQ